MKTPVFAKHVYIEDVVQWAIDGADQVKSDNAGTAVFFLCSVWPYPPFHQ